VEKAHVVTDREQMQNYLADETAAPVRPKPANDLILVRPANTQQVGCASTCEQARHRDLP
jgi:hypothetical protein